MTSESRPYQPHPAPALMSQVDRQDDLTIGSLCSGYGGLEMGLQAVVGGRVAWHVEYDKHPSAVLDARFPGIPNYGDVKKTDWSTVESVDWVTAGYPCQPFSDAGQRRGEEDERHLWPFVADAVRVIRPSRVLLENVSGHLRRGFGTVLGDLARLGYDARWTCIRAADVGAPHNRARVFVVATDASGQRHGHGQDRRSLGRMDREDAGQASQRERSRILLGYRGPAALRDAASGGRYEPADALGCPECSEPARGSGSTYDWGVYAAAVERWARVLGRPAPPATRDGRLSPVFVEWMMGLPAGWVTDVPIPEPAQRKALGNGVVPQQAALAVRTLLSLESQVAA